MVTATLFTHVGCAARRNLRSPRSVLLSSWPSELRGHPAHFDLTTSVRTASGSYSFVAASSGIIAVG